jgi:hypothetical protein
MPGGVLPSSGSLGSRFPAFLGTTTPLRLPTSHLGSLRFSLAHRYSRPTLFFALGGRGELRLAEPGGSLPWGALSQLAGEKIGSPKFPGHPCGCMPRSPTPVGLPRHRCWPKELRPSRLDYAVGPSRQDHFGAPSRGLHPCSSWLRTRITPTHAGFTTGLPAGFSRVGLPAGALTGHPLGHFDGFQDSRANPPVQGFAWREAEGSGRADLSSAQILQSLGLLQDDRWGLVAWTDKVELRACHRTTASIWQGGM